MTRVGRRRSPAQFVPAVVSVAPEGQLDSSVTTSQRLRGPRCIWAASLKEIAPCEVTVLHVASSNGHPIMVAPISLALPFGAPNRVKPCGQAQAGMRAVSMRRKLI